MSIWQLLESIVEILFMIRTEQKATGNPGVDVSLLVTDSKTGTELDRHVVVKQWQLP